MLLVREGSSSVGPANIPSSRVPDLVVDQLELLL
jgi:hypothetical protein